ncbi:hypothetical protein [Mangrovibacillus cuniculi]|uniref:Uncharacterized protein n=1 Tax=Mangrovibacillus cuniculi TaxID=2593652 RepID=A0A7S8CCQ4_9BACI|nr:hypothetical protein [Mangrovibacillus cuniculi]QPC47582.1 hypothetical protein G8O30_11775 [Mangrovibacillus cuniculi]
MNMFGFLKKKKKDAKYYLTEEDKEELARLFDRTDKAETLRELRYVRKDLKQLVKKIEAQTKELEK